MEKHYYHRLDSEFNNETNTLIIYKDYDIPLISVPFSINNSKGRFTCDLCSLFAYCRKPILGTKKTFREFCLTGPQGSYPDLERIGLTGEIFYKRLHAARIIKKLPKTKKI